MSKPAGQELGNITAVSSLGSTRRSCGAAEKGRDEEKTERRGFEEEDKRRRKEMQR